MIEQHAPLPPSSAHLWGNCSGAMWAIQAAPPQVETDSIREGNAAHWVAEQCLTNWREADELHSDLTCIDWLGKQAPNGVTITREITDGAQVLVRDVLKVCQQYGALRGIMVEQRVEMPQIHQDNWGTLDAALYLPQHGLLYVWDFKFGFESVGVEGNLQLVNYVAGLRTLLGINGHLDQHTTVVMRIVQPRDYHSGQAIKEWRVTMADLRALWNQLKAKAHEAYTNPTLTAGKHCRRCPAAGTASCPNSRRMVVDLLAYAGQPFAVDTLDDASLGTMYAQFVDLLPVASEMFKTLEETVKQRAAQGGQTGYALEMKNGRLSWNIDSDAVKAAGAMFQIDLDAHQCKTPTQALDECPAELREAFEQYIEPMTYRKAGKSTLQPAGDTFVSRVFKRTQ